MKRALLATVAALAAGSAWAVAPDLGSDADRKAGAALYDKSEESEDVARRDEPCEPQVPLGIEGHKVTKDCIG